MIIVCSTSSASSRGAHQNDTDDNDVDYENGEDDSDNAVDSNAIRNPAE